MALISLPAPLPAPLARQRLKSNLAAIALFGFCKYMFGPYLLFRAALVRGIDALTASSRPYGADWVHYLEMAITFVLVYNVAEAAYWVNYTTLVPPTPPGIKLVPVLKSSPLTRGYPAIPEVINTPTRGGTSAQSPLAQSLYKSTPTRDASTPERSSPLSASTARVLNLAQPGTPSSTGLFYDDSGSASPSKVARGELGKTVQTTTAKPVSRSDYVVMDREEREWSDNVWKGVRGKSRKLGL